MKNYFTLLIIGIALTTTVYGQNTFPSSGDVGIGTTSPATKLHFKNTLATWGTPLDYEPVNYIRIDNTQHAYINESDDDPINQTVWQIRSGAVANGSPTFLNTAGLDFSVSAQLNGQSWSSLSTVLKLNVDGNVGIGTLKPTAKLHINGNARIASLAGTGNRMVITDANGVLGFQALPTAQTLAISGNSLSISGGNTITLPSSIQTLSLSGNTLSISGGNNVSLAAFKDNLGNHTAGANLNMNGNAITSAQVIYFTSGGSVQGHVLGPYTLDNYGVGGNPSSSYRLYVYGNVHATGVYSSSDKRYKRNINSIESALSYIDKLDGVTYEYKKEEFPSLQFNSTTNSGFIAQDLKKVLPHLVAENEDGYLGVNYIGVIPYLVEGIKEQQSIIEQQNLRIEKLEDMILQIINRPDVSREETAILYQNTPNPFSGRTEIEYFLPQGTKTAEIKLYGINGVELKSIRLYGVGKQSIYIDGDELRSSIYVYSLIVDEKLIDTKKMIVQK